ncbi:MAG: glycerol-3-phosphate dehydrogenase/oxidase, partial [Deltaproteobacteria bacterium]|nr:glycerol-3-phosphate dehydrogenase/oxidase [Deltaproteobacteria bacterium]
EEAFLLTAKKDNRVFFLIPWYGQTLVGTTDTDFNGPPEEAVPTEDDIAYLLGEANRVLDGIHWEAKDVRGAFAGLRSLRHQPGQPSAVTREWSLEAPERGLLVPVGGKLTTARVDAARIVARVWPMAGKSTPLPPSPTLARPLVWNPVEGSSSPRADFAAWAGRTAGELELLGVDPQTALFCTTRYGGSIGPLRQAVSARPDLARRIHPDLPFCRGEILHGVEQEMAFSLEDVLRRRIPLAILRPIGHEILKDAASLVGGALNWDEQKTNTEIQTFTRQNLQPQWLNG